MAINEAYYKRLEKYILTRFPNNPGEGFYVRPNLPAKKLGRVLMDYTRIKSPAEVKAFYYHGTFFGSYHLVITGKTCYAPKTEFLLEDVVAGENQEKYTIVSINQGGNFSEIRIKTDSEKHAKVLARFFDGITSIPKTEKIVAEIKEKSEQLNRSEIEWIKLKDEILKTIDALYELYQAGKISSTEYAFAKEELLGRL